jgi:MGT family glycosyltransferase
VRGAQRDEAQAVKIVILTPPAHGHVNPTLPLAAALSARGDEVVYFLPESMAVAARRSGAQVRELDSRFDMPFDKTMSRFGFPFGVKSLTPDEQAALIETMRTFRAGLDAGLPALRDRIEREAADCVIYDVYGLWMRGLAQDLAAPKIAFFPTFAVPDGGSAITTVFAGRRPSLPEELRAALSGSRAFSDLAAPFAAEALNIVPLPRSFQPDAARFDDRFLFVGPSIRNEPLVPDFPLEGLAGRRVALVSLGTVATDSGGFYRACFDAFAGTDWLVVAAMGRSGAPELGPLPANVIARPFVPQLAVLRQASVFLTHGGMNSTMEALWFGVPLVVVPQGGDQPLVAERVTQLGLGRALDPDRVSGPVVREVVEEVAADAAVRTRIASTQREMRQAGGAARAAAAIHAFVDSGAAPLAHQLARAGVEP